MIVPFFISKFLPTRKGLARAHSDVLLRSPSREAEKGNEAALSGRQGRCLQTPEGHRPSENSRENQTQATASSSRPKESGAIAALALPGSPAPGLQTRWPRLPPAPPKCCSGVPGTLQERSRRLPGAEEARQRRGTSRVVRRWPAQEGAKNPAAFVRCRSARAGLYLQQGPLYSLWENSCPISFLLALLVADAKPRWDGGTESQAAPQPQAALLGWAAAELTLGRGRP